MDGGSWKPRCSGIAQMFSFTLCAVDACTGEARQVLEICSAQAVLPGRAVAAHCHPVSSAPVNLFREHGPGPCFRGWAPTLCDAGDTERL